MASAWAEDPDKISIRWTVTEGQVDDARAALQFKPDQVSADPTSVDPTKGLPLLYVLVGLVVLPDLANALVEVYKNAVNGTTIITCPEKGKCTIEHDPKGPGGIVLVKQGKAVTAEINNRQTLDAAKWLEILLGAMKAK